MCAKGLKWFVEIFYDEEKKNEWPRLSEILQYLIDYNCVENRALLTPVTSHLTML